MKSDIFNRLPRWQRLLINLYLLPTEGPLWLTTQLFPKIEDAVEWLGGLIMRVDSQYNVWQVVYSDWGDNDPEKPEPEQEAILRRATLAVAGAAGCLVALILVAILFGPSLAHHAGDVWRACVAGWLK